MTRIKRQHQLIHTKLFTSLILGIALFSSLAAILLRSDFAIAAYKPPRNQKPPSTYTDSSGVRGICTGLSERSFTLLAPVNHVGLTTLSHPTFAWVASESQTIPTEFTLYQFDQNRVPKLVEKVIVESSPGIKQLKLPQDFSGLETGKRYMWQLQTRCSPNRPSKNLILRAEIERVKTPSNLANALSAINNLEKKSTDSKLPIKGDDSNLRIKLYAEAGLWYNALSEALVTSPNGQLGLAVANLLEDLAQIEKYPQSSNLSRVSMDFEPQ
jgi:Domain of Unknown Function (DUF928)